jgi:hypothetical protein
LARFPNLNKKTIIIIGSNHSKAAAHILTDNFSMKLKVTTLLVHCIAIFYLKLAPSNTAGEVNSFVLIHPELKYSTVKIKRHLVDLIVLL